MKEKPIVEKVSNMEAPKSLPQLFEETAQRCSDLIALKSPSTTLTYAELEQVSRSLAVYLPGKIGTEPCAVSILLNDGVQVITSILGIVRAGNFYSALSLTDPPERLKKVMEDLHPRMLLTEESFLSLARQIAPQDCVIQLFHDIPVQTTASLATESPPNMTLGIFFTSGSTGNPKGVLRTHQFVIHKAYIDEQDYHPGPGDKVLYSKNFTTSASVNTIFSNLLGGATLFLCDIRLENIHSFTELINNEEISIVSIPAELLRRLLDSPEKPSFFPSVRVVLSGGDTLYRRDVERLRPLLPENAVIIHHLSSSESGLLCRTILQYDTPILSDVVPVGFPVPGKQVLILDQEGHIMPEGVAGEIAVRSDVIFPGYWNQPELSHSKFRTDPENPVGKVFCTGDLGYFLPDGQLVFLGRNDLRVKIRGFSVDCASVESTLMAEPGVSRAVVMPRTDPAGHKRLVAYIVSRPGSELSAQGLRDFLRERTPPFSVPAIFVFPDEIPLTPSMKVDRKHLPDPDWAQIPVGSKYTPPGNEIEEDLVTTWQRILGLEQVGIEDDYFDIGGDSLSAMVLFSDIEQKFNVRLPLQTLLEHGTIRSLAQLLGDPAQFETNRLVTFSESGEGKPVFLLPTGTGDAIGMLAIARQLEGPQPVYGLQGAGAGTENLYQRSTEEIAAEFVKVVQKVQAHGPYRLIGGSFGGFVAFELALELQQAGEAVAFLGLIDTLPPGPRRSPRFPDRLKVYYQNLKKLISLPLKRYPGLFKRWWRGHLVDLARRKWFPRWITVRTLRRAFNGEVDPKHPGHTAHILYFPRVYHGDVVIFRAKDKPWYTNQGEMNGWKKYIDGTITIVEVEGNHGQVYAEPYVAGLTNAIKSHLK